MWGYCGLPHGEDLRRTSARRIRFNQDGGVPVGGGGTGTVAAAMRRGASAGGRVTRVDDRSSDPVRLQRGVAGRRDVPLARLPGGPPALRRHPEPRTLQRPLPGVRRPHRTRGDPARLAAATGGTRKPPAPQETDPRAPGAPPAHRPARAAGLMVVGVTTSFSAGVLKRAGAVRVVPALHGLMVEKLLSLEPTEAGGATASRRRPIRPRS